MMISTKLEGNGNPRRVNCCLQNTSKTFSETKNTK